MMGEEISDTVRFNTPSAVVVSQKQVRGTVIHIDRFGNLITNVTSAEMTEEFIRAGARVRIGSHEPARILTHFAEANQNELFAYFGSAGFLELAVPRQSAARVVEGRRGTEVEVVIP
jgi:S-adenosylmethionine hydrolase